MSNVEQALTQERVADTYILNAIKRYKSAIKIYEKDGSFPHRVNRLNEIIANLEGVI